MQWDDFQENTIFSIKGLRDDTEFSDVTLACEDGKHFEAYKTVLASSSPFFMKLRKRHKHPNPLIYMRGLKSKDLAPMLDFFYHGEANILQDDLDSFLALAEEFQIKGLTGTSHSGEDQQKKPQQNNFIHKKEFGQQLSSQNTEPISKVKSPTQRTVDKYDNLVALTDTRTYVRHRDLDEDIRFMITKSNNSAGPGKGLLATCNVCGKQGSFRNMPVHVEANLACLILVTYAARHPGREMH